MENIVNLLNTELWNQLDDEVEEDQAIDYGDEEFVDAEGLWDLNTQPVKIRIKRV